MDQNQQSDDVYESSYPPKTVYTKEAQPIDDAPAVVESPNLDVAVGNDSQGSHKNNSHPSSCCCEQLDHFLQNNSAINFSGESLPKKVTKPRARRQTLLAADEKPYKPKMISKKRRWTEAVIEKPRKLSHMKRRPKVPLKYLDYLKGEELEEVKVKRFKPTNANTYSNNKEKLHNELMNEEHFDKFQENLMQRIPFRMRFESQTSLDSNLGVDLKQFKSIRIPRKNARGTLTRALKAKIKRLTPLAVKIILMDCKNVLKEADKCEHSVLKENSTEPEINLHQDKETAGEGEGDRLFSPEIQEDSNPSNFEIYCFPNYLDKLVGSQYVLNETEIELYNKWNEAPWEDVDQTLQLFEEPVQQIEKEKLHKEPLNEEHFDRFQEKMTPSIDFEIGLESQTSCDNNLMAADSEQSKSIRIPRKKARRTLTRALKAKVKRLTPLEARIVLTDCRKNVPKNSFESIAPSGICFVGALNASASTCVQSVTEIKHPHLRDDLDQDKEIEVEDETDKVLSPEIYCLPNDVDKFIVSPNVLRFQPFEEPISQNEKEMLLNKPLNEEHFDKFQQKIMQSLDFKMRFESQVSFDENLGADSRQTKSIPIPRKKARRTLTRALKAKVKRLTPLEVKIVLMDCKKNVPKEADKCGRLVLEENSTGGKSTIPNRSNQYFEVDQMHLNQDQETAIKDEGDRLSSSEIQEDLGYFEDDEEHSDSMQSKSIPIPQNHAERLTRTLKAKVKRLTRLEARIVLTDCIKNVTNFDESTITNQSVEIDEVYLNQDKEAAGEEDGDRLLDPEIQEDQKPDLPIFGIYCFPNYVDTSVVGPYVVNEVYNKLNGTSWEDLDLIMRDERFQPFEEPMQQTENLFDQSTPTNWRYIITNINNIGYIRAIKLPGQLFKFVNPLTNEKITCDSETEAIEQIRLLLSNRFIFVPPTYKLHIKVTQAAQIDQLNPKILDGHHIVSHFGLLNIRDSRLITLESYGFNKDVSKYVIMQRNRKLIYDITFSLAKLFSIRLLTQPNCEEIFNTIVKRIVWSSETESAKEFDDIVKNYPKSIQKLIHQQISYFLSVKYKTIPTIMACIIEPSIRATSQIIENSNESISASSELVVGIPLPKSANVASAAISNQSTAEPLNSLPMTTVSKIKDFTTSNISVTGAGVISGKTSTLTSAALSSPSSPSRITTGVEDEIIVNINMSNPATLASASALFLQPATVKLTLKRERIMNGVSHYIIKDAQPQTKPLPLIVPPELEIAARVEPSLDAQIIIEDGKSETGSSLQNSVMQSVTQNDDSSSKMIRFDYSKTCCCQKKSDFT